MAPLFPVGLLLEGKRVLVVGGGRVAARKVEALLACGASVTMVAPEVHVALDVLAANGAIAAIDGSPLEVHLRPYERSEAAEYRLVVAATGLREVDAQVHSDAEDAGVWVNSADDPEHCTAVLPAVWRDGPVSVAVSTGGSSPALAGWLRDRVAQCLDSGLAELATLLAEARRSVQETGAATESVDWRTILDGPLPALVAEGRLDEARKLLEAQVKAQQEQK